MDNEFARQLATETPSVIAVVAVVVTAAMNGHYLQRWVEHRFGFRKRADFGLVAGFAIGAALVLHFFPHTPT